MPTNNFPVGPFEDNSDNPILATSRGVDSLIAKASSLFPTL